MYDKELAKEILHQIYHAKVLWNHFFDLRDVCLAPVI